MNMFMSEVYAWIKEHGGEKNRVSKSVSIDNPDYDPSQPPSARGAPKINQTHVTVTAADGKVITYVDEGEIKSTQLDARGFKPGDREGPDGGRDPSVQIITRGDPDNTDTRSPEKKAGDAAIHAEAEWNRANGPTPDPTSPAYDKNRARTPTGGSGIYESHADRITRERQEATAKNAEEDRALRARNEAEQIKNDRERIDIERGRAQVAKEQADVQASTATRQADTAEGQLQIERDREARAGRTPQVVGNPADDQENIAYIDPNTGEIKSQANPIFNEVKTAAARKREEIRLAIESGKYNLEVGQATYKQWFDTNVATPLALAAERRAQAAETRAAQDAETRRREFKAKNDLERANLGQAGAESAQANLRAQLPYMAGPKFGEQFSSAINGLAAGGTINGPSADAGVHFTKDAFEFKSPDFKAAAKQGMKQALSHLTPYNPDDTAIAQADYTGIGMPGADIMGTAPQNIVPTNTIPAYQPQ